MNLLFRRCAATLGLALAAGSACAQAAWPERPVKVVVSAAAGSAPDIVARILGDRLTQMWGRALVIDNRPGAGGNLGAQAAARSAPDGYNFWFAHATPVVMNQFLFKSPGFDAERDFAPVVRVGINPMMVAVNPAVPAHDLKGLVALSKARAGKLSFTTSGTRNIPHLVGETLNQLTGAAMVNVPYKGSQQAAQDAIGGLAEVYIDAVPPMAPLVAGEGARLRPIAVTSGGAHTGLRACADGARIGRRHGDGRLAGADGAERHAARRDRARQPRRQCRAGAARGGGAAAHAGHLRARRQHAGARRLHPGRAPQVGQRGEGGPARTRMTTSKDPP